VQDRDQNEDQDEHDQEDRARRRHSLAAVRRGFDARAAREGDSALRRDHVRHRARAAEEPGAEAVRGEVGAHHAPDDRPDPAVGERALEPVAHFDPHPALLPREEDQDAVVLSLPSDAPRREELGGGRLDLFAPEIGERGDGELRTGLLMELARQGLDRVGARRVHDVCEVAQASGRLGPFAARRGRGEEGQGQPGTQEGRAEGAPRSSDSS